MVIKIRSQFHYGSITTVPSSDATLIDDNVSIPLWFDYNILDIVDYGTFVPVSIPLWFDYNKWVP